MIKQGHCGRDILDIFILGVAVITNTMGKQLPMSLSGYNLSLVLHPKVDVTP